MARPRTRTLNSWWHRLQVILAGRSDGKRAIPSPDAKTPADFEQQLLRQGKQAIGTLRESLAEQGAKLVAAQDEAVEHARRVVGQFKAKFHEYDAKKRTLGRGVVRQFSPHWYLPLMFFFGVSELSINIQAFRLFGEALLFTALMASVVGLGIPLCAHFLGIFFRQWPAPAWLTAIKVALVFAFAVVCLYGITIARSLYLAEGRALTAREDALQESFFYINLFVFVVGIVASYFAHDADPDFEQMREAFFALDAQCKAARTKLASIVKRLETLQQTHDAKVGQVEAAVEELTYLYRRHNRRKRKDDPLTFKDRPTLDRGGTIAALRIINKDDIDLLFRDWSNVDVTPERRREAAVPAK